MKKLITEEVLLEIMSRMSLRGMNDSEQAEVFGYTLGSFRQTRRKLSKKFNKAVLTPQEAKHIMVVSDYLRKDESGKYVYSIAQVATNHSISVPAVYNHVTTYIFEHPEDPNAKFRNERSMARQAMRQITASAHNAVSKNYIKTVCEQLQTGLK